MSLIRVYSHRVTHTRMHTAPFATGVKQYPSGGRSMTLHPVQLPFRIVVRLLGAHYPSKREYKITFSTVK